MTDKLATVAQEISDYGDLFDQWDGLRRKDERQNSRCDPACDGQNLAHETA